MPRYDLNATIIGLVRSTVGIDQLRSLILGGIQGATGGTGGRPGSIIGQLPQTKVCYDTTEEATFYTVGSGIVPSGVIVPSGLPSLVDNLNHIRARLYSLEEELGFPSGQAPGGGGVHIAVDDVYKGLGTTLNLIEGGGVTITAQDMGNIVDITLGRVGGEVELWQPDIPPPFSSDLDDEFSDSIFNTSLWTEFDTLEKVTITEEDVGLIIDSVAYTGYHVGGAYQTIPSGNWSIMTKVSLLGTYNIDSSVGLALWENAGFVGGDIITLGLQADEELDVYLWTNYITRSTNYASAYADPATDIYFRVRKNGTTYDFDYSTDGVGWLQIYTTSSLAFVPKHFGIYICPHNESETIRCVSSFFRCVDEDVGLTGVLEGGRVALGGGGGTVASGINIQKNDVAQGGGNTINFKEGTGVSITVQDTGNIVDVEITASGGGVTDHGSLTGLDDDDHPQYTKDSEFTAKGDILVATASGIFAALGVGTDGYYLKADSGETEGVAWASGVGGGNGNGGGLYGITVEGPSGSEDIAMGFTFVAVTVQEIQAVVKGIGPSITIDPYHSTVRSGVKNDILSSPTAITNITTGHNLTSFDDPTIPIDSWIIFRTTASSGIVEELSLMMRYTKD